MGLEVSGVPALTLMVGGAQFLPLYNGIMIVSLHGGVRGVNEYVFVNRIVNNMICKYNFQKFKKYCRALGECCLNVCYYYYEAFGVGITGGYVSLGRR